jgi:hypothetical protein
LSQLSRFLIGSQIFSTRLQDTQQVTCAQVTHLNQNAPVQDALGELPFLELAQEHFPVLALIFLIYAQMLAVPGRNPAELVARHLIVQVSMSRQAVLQQDVLIITKFVPEE